MARTTATATNKKKKPTSTTPAKTKACGKNAPVKATTKQQKPPPSTRFNTAADIPESLIRSSASLRGRVAAITDGDTFRMRHIPPSCADDGVLDPKDKTLKLVENTIVVRIAGVDTPETAKRGMPAQPFGEEAKAFATEQLLGKIVRVKLLSKDQYGRVVCKVKYGWPEKDYSAELLKKGLGFVYRQGGAQYDGKKEEYEKMEKKAKKKKKGVWGVEMETPAEWKKKMKEEKQTMRPER